MIKELMIKGMDKVMLDCDVATHLITRSEVEKIDCVKRIQLKMHLAGCKFCRRFKVQSELIDKSLKTLEDIHLQQNDDQLTNKLSKEKKEEFQQLLMDS